MIDSNAIEFLSLNKNQKAQVIFEMVDDLMKETQLPKEICIAIIAEYKKYSVFQIEQYIKIANPKFYYYATMYDGDTLLYKNNIDTECVKSIKKNLSEVILQYPFEISSMTNFLKTTLKDYYESVEWLTFCK